MFSGKQHYSRFSESMQASNKEEWNNFLFSSALIHSNMKTTRCKESDI